MGEVEKKKEEMKKEEKKTEEPKKEKEIVLKVFMHCEGCAKKVRSCLKGFQGVENVETDCKTHKVVVKGEKADPSAVMDRVQKKSHRHVELLSPMPKPSAEDSKKAEEKQVLEKPPEKKEEPQLITVVLRVQMHCEACAQEIRRRILKMSGVEEVEPDLKSSQVTVKGIFDTPKLVEYVHKRTGKHALIVKQEPDNSKEEEKAKEEKKTNSDKAAAEPRKDGGGEAVTPPAEGEEEAAKVVDLKKNEFYYNYPQNFQINPYPQRYETQHYQQYVPQMFSDENPNACSVM